MVGEDRALRVAGRADGRQLQVLPLEALDELPPVHGRHHHVGDERVDLAAAMPAQLERLEPVRRLEHVVSVELERLAHIGADDLLVLDDEDRSRCALAWPERGRLPQDRPPAPLDAREVDRERGTRAGRAVDVDLAAGLLDDPVHRREAEPRAAGILLGGVEGLERVRADLLGHADAGVPDGDRREPARRYRQARRPPPDRGRPWPSRG